MPRILVADDNTNIQKMVSLALQERGVEVTSVSNGEAAVRRVPDLNPDLILADIFMPVRNGYELCEWVKKDSKYSHIPVILLVGAFDPLDEKEARRVGADGVLKKPFIPPDPLIAMVTSTLEKIPKPVAEPSPVKLSPAVAPPVSAPIANAPAKVITAPAPVIPVPDRQATPPDFDFGTGRIDSHEDEPEDFASVTAPQADFGRQVEDEVEEPEPQSHWRPSTMAFEVPEENAQESESAVDVAASAPQGGPVHEDHAGEFPETLGAKESEDFFDEPLAPISLQQESTESLDAHPEFAAPRAPEPEPSFSSKSSHWMDLMSSNAAVQPQQDWLSSLAVFQSTEHPSPLEAVHETENIGAAPAGIEPSASEPDVLHTSVASTEQFQENNQSAPASEGDCFFADESQASSDTASAASHEEQTAEEPSLAREKADPVHIEWPAGEPSQPIGATQPWQHAATSVEMQPSDTSAFLLEEDASDGSNIAQEPELVAPSPVRPVSEPLLIDESEKKNSDYDSREEEIPPAFSFLPEVEKHSAAPSSAMPELEAPPTAATEFFQDEKASPAPSESHVDASFSEPAASHEPDASASVGADPAASLGSLSSPSSHEIPAAPLPSPEDVAAIPFLNPPPDFDRDEYGSSMTEAASADALAIEDVVERVLLKIEPQLRDLLSQNLKPLIESLVQNEIQKKER